MWGGKGQIFLLAQEIDEREKKKEDRPHLARQT